MDHPTHVGSVVVATVSWAPPTVLKLMGSYLAFVIAGLILVLFCLEVQPAPGSPSSCVASASQAAVAADRAVQKLQLKVGQPEGQGRPVARAARALYPHFYKGWARGAP